MLATQYWDLFSGGTYNPVRNWKFNGSGCQGLTLDQCRQAVIAAATKWYNVRNASPPNFQYQSPDLPSSTKPSMLKNKCAAGTSTTNSVNEIGFCNLSGAYGIVATSPSIYALQPGDANVTVCDPDTVAQPCLNVEADMVLHSQTTYTVNSLRNLALHEFGHWLPLGDLRPMAATYCEIFPGPPPGNTLSKEDNRQTMCAAASLNDNTTGTRTVVNHGDKAGVRFLYPSPHLFTPLTSNTVKGTDIAAGSIDGTSNKDLLVVFGDYTTSTAIKVKPIWNIIEPSSTDPPTDTSDPVNLGSPTTWGTTTSLNLSVSGAVLDIGATLANVDSGSVPDLVVTYTTGSSTTKYKIFFNIQRLGDGITWTSTYPTTGVASIPGTTGDRGTDIEVFDVTGDGPQDLLIMDSFNSKFWYYIGKSLQSGGTVLAWNTGFSVDILTASGDYLGGTVLDSTDRRINLVYKDSVNSYPRYQTIKFNTGDTAPISNSHNKYGPLNKLGTLTGLGNAFTNLDPSYAEQPGWATYREQAIVWTQGSDLYYMFDWQSRQNSHG